ncbi:hypothetical protein N431DRAFT_440853 [Stipitochalara longipes BDJ]|nr:hypothetical protein N431DRAFT_440853 [Stipitochalara longipes BDJ]
MTDEQLQSVKENKSDPPADNEQSDGVENGGNNLTFSNANLYSCSRYSQGASHPLEPTCRIHFTILKKLHIVNATCLGLTNTKLYAVLKAIYPGKISIDPYAYSYNWAKIGLLGELISGWMKLRLLWDGFVFVTPKRYKELEDKDHDLGVRAQRDYIGKW